MTLSLSLSLSLALALSSSRTLSSTMLHHTSTRTIALILVGPSTLSLTSRHASFNTSSVLHCRQASFSRRLTQRQCQPCFEGDRSATAPPFPVLNDPTVRQEHPPSGCVRPTDAVERITNFPSILVPFVSQCQRTITSFQACLARPVMDFVAPCYFSNTA